MLQQSHGTAMFVSALLQTCLPSRLTARRQTDIKLIGLQAGLADLKARSAAELEAARTQVS